MHSDESLHAGFLSDLYSSFYPLGAASPVLRSLDLERHGLRWTHAPTVLAHVWPDGRSAALSRDARPPPPRSSSFAAGDGDAWLQLVEHSTGSANRCWIRCSPRSRRSGPAPTWPGDWAWPTAAVRPLRALPVRRFGEEQFPGEGGPLLLAGNALHTDLGPRAPAARLFGWLLAMLGQTVGFPVPVGGSSGITGSA